MRALLSVHDKNGLVGFAQQLHDFGYELVSTGGTGRALADAGLPVTLVEEVTGFPEILDGRVKTLHPHIHGGLLARVDTPGHLDALRKHGIQPFDILVSNLYPFEQAASDTSLNLQDKIEQIDIGGPAMVRAAAKNHASVIVVTDPSDYGQIANALGSGEVNQSERRRLAAKAFGHVSTYDSLVAAFLRDNDPKFPDELTLPLRHASTPHYGENPHQQAAAYARLSIEGTPTGILNAGQIAGEPLSFNNYLDGDAAWQAAQLFSEPTVAIVKHMVPCGLAIRGTLAQAYDAAFAGDPVSAFGGIVALNRVVDQVTATKMRRIKLDMIIAPSYDDDALETLLRKKNTRILTLPNRADSTVRHADFDVRPIDGGLLVQVPDSDVDDSSEWKVVTDIAPTEAQCADLEFAWKVARLVRSNAIVFARNNAVVGLGAGQPNRLESVAIAARKARDNAKGAAMASDAFFPFADGIQQAIDAGVTSVIQPGGSLRDEEVIAAANAAGITMLFTGTRHFRH